MTDPDSNPDESAMTTGNAADHWDQAYALGATTRSWYQDQPAMSLRMFDTAGVSTDDSVIDIGGGASTLADSLLERSFTDITVLDVSATGLHAAQERLGATAGRVQWLIADLLHWRPKRQYQVWHDRAVFHFLVSSNDQHEYLRVLRSATTIGAVAIFGCFAPDGPQQCSGLPVARYDAYDIAAQLGKEWSLIHHARENHVTPANVLQPFTWAAFQRRLTTAIL
jgi:hypothetical protein